MFPVTTATVAVMNKTVQTPRLAKLNVLMSASVPPLYTVVIAEQVQVIAAEVLLNMLKASPAPNTEALIVTEPPVPSSINLPTSPATGL
jgi:hypothetical protein